MNEREEKYYEKFKSNEISDENLRKGEVKAKNLGDKKNDFLMLIEMIKAATSREYPLPAWAIVAIIGAIIYVVSPIDAVPDIIPIAGLVDDGAVVAASIGGLGTVISSYLEYKKEKERNQ